MPDYTMTLAEAFEFTGGSYEQVSGRTILTNENIGLSHYPIFDEDHRPILNGMIFDHYMLEEIGFETVDIFRLKLRSTMNEIMPAYNKLYMSEKMLIDPMMNINIETVAAGENEQTSTNASSSETLAMSDSKSRTVVSDTPQTVLSGNSDYATGLSDTISGTGTEGTGKEKSTGTSEGRDNRTSTTKGYQGNASQLLMDYRATILGIDAMVISDLADLFMQIKGHYNMIYRDRGHNAFS